MLFQPKPHIVRSTVFSSWNYQTHQFYPKYVEFIFKGKALTVKQLKKGGVGAIDISIESLKGKIFNISDDAINHSKLMVSLTVAELV